MKTDDWNDWSKGCCMMKFACIICSCILALLFLSIGWVTRNMEQPSWYFLLGNTREKYKAEDFTCLSAFNHANGLLWIFSGILFLLIAVASFFLTDAVAMEMIVIALLLQIPLSFLIYRALIKKYLNWHSSKAKAQEFFMQPLLPRFSFFATILKRLTQSSKSWLIPFLTLPGSNLIIDWCRILFVTISICFICKQLDETDSDN